MYYNDYEDYMRSVLGYNAANTSSNMYSADYYMPNRMQAVMPTYQNESMGVQMQDNIEDLYPHIYKIVNPIVCRVCQNNNRPITNEVLEQMTMEVYNSIEADDINIVNINIETGDINNKEINNRHVDTKDVRDSKISQEKKESRGKEENRQRRPNNPLLRDLIRILILNRLFGRFRPGNRPPVRPPFPGPGMPGRPPMTPRYTGGIGNNIEAEPQMGMYGYDNYYRY